MNLILLILSGIVSLLLILFLFIYLYFQYSFKYWSKRNVPHFKPTFPFGNFDKNITSMSGVTIRDYYKELKKSGATYGGLYLLYTPIFIPVSLDMIKNIFIKNFQNFHDFGMHSDEVIEPVSAVLVALEGEKWDFMRKKMTPAFSIAKLKMLFSTMQQSTKNLFPILNSSEVLDIHDITTRYTTDIICSCVFGVEANSLKNPNSDIRKYGIRITHPDFFDNMRFILALKAPKLMKMLKTTYLNPEIGNFFYNMVKETIEYREANNIQRNDFLDMLIRLKNNQNIEDYEVKNDGESISLNQIAAQVFFLYWAGFDTTSTGLTACLYEMCKNKEIQEKVRNEILEKIGGDITFENLNEMHYMEKVLLETLRKYPPVLLVNRACTKDYQLPDSKTVIKKGIRVVVPTLGVHYDPEYYPDPEKFDPERFSEEEMAKRHPMAFIPFGEGPRKCLGWRFAILQMKLSLVSFLKHYKYDLDPQTSKNIEIGSCGNLLKLRQKIWLKITKL